MQVKSRISSLYTIIILLVIQTTFGGCTVASRKSFYDPPSFNKGLDALQAEDFSKASFYFAELAKGGDPAAMNNLGVALMMVKRKEEAIFWFKKATRYGDHNAPFALEDLGVPVPFADLIGKHPTVLVNKKNAELIGNIMIGALIGIALGVSLKYSIDHRGSYIPNHNPWLSNSTDTTLLNNISYSSQTTRTSPYPTTSGSSFSIARDVCNCKGYAGAGGPCYAGPGGAAYNGPGGPAYAGPGGHCYAGPGGSEYSGPGGDAYAGPGGARDSNPGGAAYNGPGGPAYDGLGGPCYSGPGGSCYSGPGGTGIDCPSVCR